MNRRELISLLGAASALPAAAQTPRRTAPRPPRELSAEERANIEAAIPSRAPAKPEQARRLLVMSTTANYGGHASIPASRLAIRLMGEKTGAYETVINDDVEALAPDNLSQFDALIFANTTGVITEDPVLRLSLLNFVAGGKGFLGFHAAAATFVRYPVYDQFPAFGEMIGGYENGGHTWGAKDTYIVRVEDSDSLITAPFEGRNFEVNDEMFQFMDGHFTREKLHVLLSIAPETTRNAGDRRIHPDRQKDLDFPITWIKRYGLGRVFYTTLGHNPHIWWDPKLLQHFLAGIQFTIGDLKADTTPSITQPGESRG